MKCPFCAAADTTVVDSRLSEDGDLVRRRRRCLTCDKRFTTYERAEIRLPRIVKRNGSRVEYRREKLTESLGLALRKRPVTTEAVEAAIDHIEEKLLQTGEREVSSQQVGEMVMRELKRLDKVAYIRFASVYRNFEDVDAFSEVIREVSPGSVGVGNGGSGGSGAAAATVSRRRLREAAREAEAAVAAAAAPGTGSPEVPGAPAAPARRGRGSRNPG